MEDKSQNENEPITEKEFKAFEAVRVSGVTNMWATQVVAELSGGILTRKRTVKVIEQYEALMEKYPDIRRRDGK